MLFELNTQTYSELLYMSWLYSCSLLQSVRF